MKTTINYLLLFFGLFIIIALAQSIYNPLYVLKEAKYLGLPYDFRGFIKIFLYLGGYISAVIALGIILAIKSSRLFFLFLFFLFLFYTMDFFMQLIGTSYGFSYNELIVAMNEKGNIHNLLNYIDYVIYAILLSLGLSTILYMIRKKIYKTSINSMAILVIFIAFLGTYIPVAVTSSITFKTFPAFTKIPMLYIEYLKDAPTIKARILDETIKPSKETKYKNIVWIIDESVTGSYLSINGYNKETTPYLKNLDKETDIISNFGLVNSISNCSAQSNLFLRIGMNPYKTIDFKKEMYDLPTIFQYAKRAGYTTQLFDSQAAKDHLQNYLTLYDKNHIDHFETLDGDVLPENRDEIFLKKIKKVLNTKDNNKNFIVIVKFGVHWPYLLSYNKENSTFVPILNGTLGGMTLENKEKQVNTYLNAIVHSTDQYLKKLINDIDLENSVLFYTSDHGQNILETERKITHCNHDKIVKNEVTVPLFVFHKNAKEIFSRKQKLSYSQIQIFPTTLSLMGYNKEIVQQYGKTLWEGFPQDTVRKYFVTSSGRINKYK